MKDKLRKYFLGGHRMVTMPDNLKLEINEIKDVKELKEHGFEFYSNSKEAKVMGNSYFEQIFYMIGSVGYYTVSLFVGEKGMKPGRCNIDLTQDMTTGNFIG